MEKQNVFKCKECPHYTYERDESSHYCLADELILDAQEIRKRYKEKDGSCGFYTKCKEKYEKLNWELSSEGRIASIRKQEDVLCSIAKTLDYEAALIIVTGFAHSIAEAEFPCSSPTFSKDFVNRGYELYMETLKRWHLLLSDIKKTKNI